MELPFFVRFYGFLMVPIPILIIAGTSLSKFSRSTGLFSAYQWYIVATVARFSPLSLQAGADQAGAEVWSPLEAWQVTRSRLSGQYSSPDLADNWCAL